MPSCAVSCWLREEATEYSVYRMVESVSQVPPRTAPSADTADQIDAGMERGDLGLMMCILLFQDVS